jgi:hypothetical protein
MRSRWFYRGMALGLGCTAALVTLGSRGLAQKKAAGQASALRARANDIDVAYYVGKGDSVSARARQAVFLRQEAIRTRGFQPEDFDWLIGALDQPVDPLILCREVAILRGAFQQKQLDSQQRNRLAQAARRLLGHKEAVVRCYALVLCRELRDREAKAIVDRMAAQDPDPEARRRALKTQAALAKQLK